MPSLLEQYVAGDVARGVPEDVARRKWASVLGWTDGAEEADPVFWTAPVESTERDLEAAASQITPEPEVGGEEDFSKPKPGESLEEYGERYGAMLRAQTAALMEATAARSAAGYKDADRMAIDEEYATPPLSPRDEVPGGTWSSEPFRPARLTGEGVPAWAQGAFGASTGQVDGVNVPMFDKGDGRMRYSLRDLRLAKEAEAEARWMAGHRQMVEDDIFNYGHYNLPDDSPELTDSQRMARAGRRQAEQNQRDQVARIRQARIDSADRPLTPHEKQQQERRQRLSDINRLAGGSQNVNSGNRAFFQALATLQNVAPDDMDAQQRVIVDMMRMDPMRARAAEHGGRVGVMNREVDARMEAIRAESERAREDRAAQSEQFQARLEEMRADRERSRQEFETRMAAEAEARRQQNEQVMAKLAQDAAEAQNRFGLGSKEADARMLALQAQIEQNRAENARMMAQFSQQAEAARADREARMNMHTEGLQADLAKTEAIIGKDKEATALARSEAAKARELQFMQSDPGAYDIMTGRSDTPAAIRALKKLASQSEDTWTEDILDPTVYLTLGLADSGFDAGNARRMNDALKRMAQQSDLIGINTRLNDPAYRRQLINDYGFNSGWAGGQGGWFGSLWRTMPEDLR